MNRPVLPPRKEWNLQVALLKQYASKHGYQNVEDLFMLSPDIFNSLTFCFRMWLRGDIVQ